MIFRFNVYLALHKNWSLSSEKQRQIQSYVWLVKTRSSLFLPKTKKKKNVICSPQNPLVAYSASHGCWSSMDFLVWWSSYQLEFLLFSLLPWFVALPRKPRKVHSDLSITIRYSDLAEAFSEVRSCPVSNI